jgi:hypothetical protein
VNIEWGRMARGIALAVLGLYAIYTPFAYKFARDEGYGRVVALAHVIIFYVLFCLWVAGGASAVYGLGMVIDHPDETCGIGCVVQGDGHWQMPQGAFILLGAILMLVAWFLGKSMERFQYYLKAKYVSDPKVDDRTGLFDLQKLEKTRQSFQELSEAYPGGELIQPAATFKELDEKKKANN